MEEQDSRIHRNSNLVKGFMALVIIAQTLEYYQSNVIDFGDIAGAAGVLLFLRGLLASPKLLIAPIKHWFKSKESIPKESYKYFVLAIVLFAVSLSGGIAT